MAAKPRGTERREREREIYEFLWIKSQKFAQPAAMWPLRAKSQINNLWGKFKRVYSERLKEKQAIILGSRFRVEFPWTRLASCFPLSVPTTQGELHYLLIVDVKHARAWTSRCFPYERGNLLDALCMRVEVELMVTAISHGWQRCQIRHQLIYKYLGQPDWAFGYEM